MNAHHALHEGREEEVRGEADEEALDSDIVGRVEHAIRGRQVKRRLVALWKGFTISAMAVVLDIIATSRMTLARSPPGTTVGGW